MTPGCNLMMFSPFLRTAHAVGAFFFFKSKYTL